MVNKRALIGAGGAESWGKLLLGKELGGVVNCGSFGFSGSGERRWNTAGRARGGTRCETRHVESTS